LPLYFPLFFTSTLPPPPRSTLFPYTTLFRSTIYLRRHARRRGFHHPGAGNRHRGPEHGQQSAVHRGIRHAGSFSDVRRSFGGHVDRKSTRLNSSHVAISYAVFCLKKKKRRR